MDLNEQKRQLSEAFLRAVSAAARCGVSLPETDDDSVDITLLSRLPKRPRIDVQLKATGDRTWLDKDHIPFPLSVKNYDDLRLDDVSTPRILVVLILPNECGEWIAMTEEEIRVRYCGYWLSLRGFPPKNNESSVTVRVPRGNRMTPETLTEMMTRISGGGLP